MVTGGDAQTDLTDGLKADRYKRSDGPFLVQLTRISIHFLNYSPASIMLPLPNETSQLEPRLLQLPGQT